jgi:uncharacterized OB-fold protein
VKIVPQVTAENEGFWSAAKDGRFVLQQCRECHRVWLPSQPNCPGCLSTQWDWTPASGFGRLISFTTVVHPVHLAVADEVPYVLGLVELREGPLYVSRIPDVSEESLQLGQEMVVRFTPLPDGNKLPVFTPA